MRYLLIAIMIVLLPVRGWVGNAMALDGAWQKAAAAQVAAGAGTQAMPEDCPMHAQTAVADADDAVGAPPVDAGAHCSGCDTCELCLALASFVLVPAVNLSVMPQASPGLAATSFTDADVFSGLKPPIS